MEKRHREAIQKNFSTLVEQTDLDLMVAVLYEKGVFSEPMLEPYKDTNKDVRTRKRKLYLDIMRRGPDAFRHLLDALEWNGYWSIVRDLDPDVLPKNHTRQGENSFLSLFQIKRMPMKEQDEPNTTKDKVTPSSTSPRNEPQSPNDNVTTSSTSLGNDNIIPETIGGSEVPVTIPEFNVVKSTKFHEDNGNEMQLYRTRGRLRGVLVLFSFIDFDYNIEDPREGARVDIDNLRYLFTELGFKVLSYFDITKEATEEALKNLKHGLCAEGPETVFVVFSSHGYARRGTGDTDIRCSDGKLISCYNIISYFSNENFPALYGVPKVFIFQNCRGSSSDYVRAPPHMPAPTLRARTSRSAHSGHCARSSGRVAHDGHAYTDSDHDDRDHDHDEYLHRMYSDIIIANSTLPGYVSNRDKVTGSWYIQALCDVFSQRAHDCHVDMLFTLVDKQLQRRFYTQTSSVDRWGFNKLLYLHPGLYED